MVKDRRLNFSFNYCWKLNYGIFSHSTVEIYILISIVEVSSDKQSLSILLDFW